jgi:hypothetical protein
MGSTHGRVHFLVCFLVFLKTKSILGDNILSKGHFNSWRRQDKCWPMDVGGKSGMGVKSK